VGGARGREIALVREVGALAVRDAVDELGDEPVQVAVALAVRVRGHVDGHAVDRGREVGAVVEVEAAQEILVRLAVAECCVTIDAGTNSSTSAGRSVGLLSISAALTTPWLAASDVPTALM
jgi:hypothetical protein